MLTKAAALISGQAPHIRTLPIPSLRVPARILHACVVLAQVSAEGADLAQRGLRPQIAPRHVLPGKAMPDVPRRIKNGLLVAEEAPGIAQPPALRPAPAPWGRGRLRASPNRQAVQLPADLHSAVQEASPARRANRVASAGMARQERHHEGVRRVPRKPDIVLAEIAAVVTDGRAFVAAEAPRLGNIEVAGGCEAIGHGRAPKEPSTVPAHTADLTHDRDWMPPSVCVDQIRAFWYCQRRVCVPVASRRVHRPRTEPPCALQAEYVPFSPAQLLRGQAVAIVFNRAVPLSEPFMPREVGHALVERFVFTAQPTKPRERWSSTLVACLDVHTRTDQAKVPPVGADKVALMSREAVYVRAPMVSLLGTPGRDAEAGIPTSSISASSAGGRQSPDSGKKVHTQRSSRQSQRVLVRTLLRVDRQINVRTPLSGEKSIEWQIIVCICVVWPFPHRV